MTELEEEILSEIELNTPYLWWRYTGDFFFLEKHGEEKLKNFIKHFNEKHQILRSTGEWSQASINVLDATISLVWKCYCR